MFSWRERCAILESVCKTNFRFNLTPRLSLKGKNMLKKIVAIMIICSTSGCSFISGENGIFRDRRQSYRDAEISPAMEIPNSLDSYTIDQLYVIPSEFLGDAIPFEDIPMPEPIETKRREGVIIQNLGERRWIVLDATPAQVWPLVRDFWTQLQVNLDYENPTSGLMETAWVEVNAEPLLRHKYRISIEPGLHSGYAEIYVTHLSNLRSDPIPVLVNWPDSSESEDRERQIMDAVSQYLADRNDVYQASTSSLLAGSIDAERKANIVTGLNGQKKLQLRVDYNRAWVQVRQAIERAEVEILETDRDEAKIVVSFSGIQEEEVKVGFLRSLISRGSKKVDDQRSLQLTVRITDVDDYIEIVPETSDSIDDSLEIDVLFDQFLTVIYDNLS